MLHRHFLCSKLTSYSNLRIGLRLAVEHVEGARRSATKQSLNVSRLQDQALCYRSLTLSTGNNCTRGGFICEGYANKIPWPKNGVSKPPPPLQAKERMSAEVASVYARCQVCSQIHIPHCEPPRQTSYPESHPQPSGTEGARGRPISVEEHERNPPAPSSWGSSWNEQQQPPRVPYPQEPPPPAQYAPPPPNHERPPSHEQQTASQQRQDPSHQRQHNPRVYHHTPQSMSQVATNVPTASAYPMQNNSA